MAAVSIAHGDGGVALHLDDPISYEVVDRTVRAIQSAAPQWVEFRKRVGDDAHGDCWIYAVLAPAEWRELESDNGSGVILRALFEPLPPSAIASP